MSGKHAGRLGDLEECVRWLIIISMRRYQKASTNEVNLNQFVKVTQAATEVAVYIHPCLPSHMRCLPAVMCRGQR